MRSLEIFLEIHPFTICGIIYLVVLYALIYLSFVIWRLLLICSAALSSLSSILFRIINIIISFCLVVFSRDNSIPSSWSWIDSVVLIEFICLVVFSCVVSNSFSCCYTVVHRCKKQQQLFLTVDKTVWFLGNNIPLVLIVTNIIAIDYVKCFVFIVRGCSLVPFFSQPRFFITTKSQQR